MYSLYKKNESNFAVMWIIAYVIMFIVADSFSTSLGIAKIITASVGIVFTLLIYGFMKKHDLLEKYGLCPFKGKLKNYLYFMPLILLISTQFWNGVTMNVPVFEAVLFVVSMLCVGFIEEVIFRGFLFKAMCKDNVKLAILVSSITFGLGHIVNLLNGRDLLLTLLQICYAIPIGFVFTILFYKGKSLWPCIITHGVFNSLGIFAIKGSSVMASIIFTVVLCVISMGYALWIVRTTKKDDVQCSQIE